MCFSLIIVGFKICNKTRPQNTQILKVTQKSTTQLRNEGHLRSMFHFFWYDFKILISNNEVCLISFSNAIGRRELVIAHRGDSEFAPENTMGSFQQAVEKNTDGIETDLRLTSDGHIVLFHDAVNYYIITEKNANFKRL